MFVIVGGIVVTICVFGGFILAGGNIMVLFQPIELIVIGGSAFGSMILMSPGSQLKDIMKQVIGAFSAKEVSKDEYQELLMLLFEILKTAKQNLLGLEAHVENPEASDIFSKYPNILKNHHVIHFICDTMKVQISSPVSPYDLEDLMDTDISAAHNEELRASDTVSNIGDAFPGLGIVAAVMGVVITMGKLDKGKEVIGMSVAAALVGTFVGVLLSYGFVGPLGRKMKSVIEDQGKTIEVTKIALLAFAKNCSPKVCVEFARRTIPPHARPSFEVL